MKQRYISTLKQRQISTFKQRRISTLKRHISTLKQRQISTWKRQISTLNRLNKIEFLFKVEVVSTCICLLGYYKCTLGMGSAASVDALAVVDVQRTVWTKSSTRAESMGPNLVWKVCFFSVGERREGREGRAEADGGMVVFTCCGGGAPTIGFGSSNLCNKQRKICMKLDMCL